MRRTCDLFILIVLNAHTKSACTGDDTLPKIGIAIAHPPHIKHCAAVRGTQNKTMKVYRSDQKNVDQNRKRSQFKKNKI